MRKLQERYVEITFCGFAASFTYLLVVIGPVAICKINILENGTRLGTLGFPALTGSKVDQLQSTALDRHNGLELAIVLDIVRDGL